MTRTEIWLIRHGETDWNANGTLQGHIDIPLNSVGKLQADGLGEFLSRNEINVDFCDTIYSSDLQRATLTAELIKGKFENGRFSHLNTDQRLREVHAGILQGKKLSQCGVRSHDAYSPIAPEGESYFEVQQRVVKAIEGIVQKHQGKTILVVLHGGSNKNVFMFCSWVRP
ncbi:hypothetical protein AKO1_004088 [Acrasis kona]|uniref:Phosphoglycerate mutase n=1 Tax=Acrasis kona TaxID=1008807 RepID=A0AAW2YW54_9EUKA